MSLEEQFNAAVKVIQSLPKNGPFQPSDEMRLRFYAFFKQATIGPNNSKKPPFYDIVNRYKWDAWKQCGEMSKDEAMKLYVEELKKVIETISLGTEVSEFLDILGPFYEFLPEEQKQQHRKSSASADDDEFKENQLNTNQSEDQMVRFVSYDSDGDEFADTYDGSNSPQNNKHPPVFGLVEDNGHIVVKQVNEMNHKINSSPNIQTSTINNQLTGLSFNEQLTMAIFQLQNSIEHINNRIKCLESNEQKLPQQEKERIPKNWPFPEIGPKTTIFLMCWPIIVYFMMNYLKTKKPVTN